MATTDPIAQRAWRRAAILGILLVLGAFWLSSQIPQTVCGGDPTRHPFVLFQLARHPSDIATLFGMDFGGPCTAGLIAGFDYANRLTLFLFLPLTGFFLGQIAWLIGKEGHSAEGALLIGFWATALFAAAAVTLLQLHIGQHVPGSPTATQMLGLAGRATYLGLAAYALMSAYLLWHAGPTAAPRWLAGMIGASGLLTLLALLGILPQDWLLRCVALGWLGLLGLAMAHGFDKSLHKTP